MLSANFITTSTNNKNKVLIVLGYMDLDLVLRIEQLTSLSDDSQ